MRSFFTAVLVSLIILDCNGIVLSATYYVAVDGNDKNSGTEQQPWRSLSKAASTAVANDKVYIKDGVYIVTNTISFTHSGSIIFSAYPDHKPIFRYTGDQTYAFLIKGKDLTFTGLTFSRATEANGNVLTIGGQNTVINSCTIYFESGYNPTKYDAIKITRTGHNTRIEDCEIYNAPQQGIDTVGADNLIIKNNIIHDSANAIVLKGGSNNDLIEGNVCFNLKNGAIGIGGWTSPKFHDYRYENSHSVIRNNIIYYDNVHNSGVGGGIFLWGSKDARVFNNTIYGAGIHVKVGGYPFPPDNITIFSVDNRIYNNIIWRTGDDGIFVVDSGNEVGLDLRNNIYWKTTGSGEFKINGKWHNYNAFKSLVSYDQNSFFTNPLFENVAAFNFSLSKNSPAIDQGTEVDVAAFNFSLSKNSPAIDQDKEGVRPSFSGSGIDIGALELKKDLAPPSQPKNLILR